MRIFSFLAPTTMILLLTITVLFTAAPESYVKAEDYDPSVMIAQAGSGTPDSKKSPRETSPSKSPSPAATKATKPGPAKSLSPSPEASAIPTPAATDTPPVSEEASPPPPETTGSPAKKGFDIQKYIIPIAASVGGLIIILVVLLLVLRKKEKHVCERCGKAVLPGMVYCEECADQRSPRQEKETAPTVRAVLKDELKPVADKPPGKSETTKVKPRPTGRVIAVITVRRGSNQGYRYNFYESLHQIAIGSDTDCDMVIEEDEEVSPRHAVLTMAEDTSFLIMDMGNTSGLFINSNRVSKSGLKSGDVIRLGKTELTFARL